MQCSEQTGWHAADDWTLSTTKRDLRLVSDSVLPGTVRIYSQSCHHRACLPCLTWWRSMRDQNVLINHLWQSVRMQALPQNPQNFLIALLLCDVRIARLQFLNMVRLEIFGHNLMVLTLFLMRVYKCVHWISQQSIWSLLRDLSKTQKKSTSWWL